MAAGAMRPLWSVDAVGYFEIRDERANRTQYVEVKGNDDFFIGRGPKSCRVHFPYPTISHKHLRVHCLVYEAEPSSGIAPLVYATDLSVNGTKVERATTNLCFHMKKGSEVIVLEAGDQLTMYGGPVLTFHLLAALPSQDGEHRVLDYVQEVEKQYFEPDYQILNRRLGIGGQGSVFVALHRGSQRQVACKIIDLRHARENDGAEGGLERSPPKLQSFGPGVKRRREFELLKNLSHVSRLEKVFYSPSTVYIFSELLPGGDLFSLIEREGGKVQEFEATVIMFQLLKGVEYLHDMGVVHRDLKPDNILLTSFTKGARVVLTDFGNARRLPPQNGNMTRQSMKTTCGTVEYAAPEIYSVNPRVAPDAGYTKAVDMWAAGLIVTTLLSGDVLFTDRQHPDFNDDPRSAILPKAAACNLEALDSDDKWKKIGKRPKDFIKRCLVLDEKKRIDVKRALTHSWFTTREYADTIVAIYRRAISDWRPRRSDANIIEELKIRPRVPNLYAMPSSSPKEVSPFFRNNFTTPNRPAPVASSLKRSRLQLTTISEDEEHDQLASSPLRPTAGNTRRMLQPVSPKARAANQLTKNGLDSQHASSPSMTDEENVPTDLTKLSLRMNDQSRDSSPDPLAPDYQMGNTNACHVAADSVPLESPPPYTLIPDSNPQQWQSQLADQPPADPNDTDVDPDAHTVIPESPKVAKKRCTRGDSNGPDFPWPSVETAPRANEGSLAKRRRLTNH